jgi:hypothetical protein
MDLNRPHTSGSALHGIRNHGTSKRCFNSEFRDAYYPC